MALRDDLIPIVEDTLRKLGGSASVRDVHKQIWLDHEPMLKAAGDDFYVWQYETRWAAQKLVDFGVITKTDPRGIWRLLP